MWRPQAKESAGRVHYRLLENKQGLTGTPPGSPPACTKIHGTTPNAGQNTP